MRHLAGAASSTSAPSGTTAGADRVDLGDQPVGTVVAFDVPAGTIGFTVVVARAAAANEVIGVEELVDPTGKTWSDRRAVSRGRPAPASA